MHSDHGSRPNGKEYSGEFGGRKFRAEPADQEKTIA
jgi:hypothetical protein